MTTEHRISRPRVKWSYNGTGEVVTGEVISGQVHLRSDDGREQAGVPANQLTCACDEVDTLQTENAALRTELEARRNELAGTVERMTAALQS